MSSDLEYEVSKALDDARCYLTRAYAANDPEIRELVRTVMNAARPEIERQAKRAVLEGFRDAVGVAEFKADSYDPSPDSYCVYSETLERYIKNELASLDGE